MAKYVFDKITYMKKKFFGKMKIKILILGIAFKENISDIRNSQVIKILKMMKSSDFKIYVYDPHIDKNKSFLSKKINFLNKLNKINFFDAIFIGTPHKKIIKIGGKKIKSFCKQKSFIFDLKSSLNKKFVDDSL